MTTKTIICVTCPVGCEMRVTHEGEKLIRVEGNTCKRGEKYASDEITSPRRTLTSTVKISSGGKKERFLPVKTDKPIKKSSLVPAMGEINKIALAAPVKMGDIIMRDFTEEGINLVAGKDME